MPRSRLHRERVKRDGKTIPILVHPCKGAKAVIINYPGFRGDIDGYALKYRHLGEWLVQKRIGAFIQMPNICHKDEPYEKSVIADLRAVVRHAIDIAPDIADSPEPIIYLMGFSAGAGAVAAVASEYKAVKKILLMAPSGDASPERVRVSLERFRGEVYIAIGDSDDVVGPDAGKRFYDLVKRASRKELVTIPYCDHQFRGIRNGMIMSKAPLWAFAGDETFPSPEGGYLLYH